MSKIVLLNILPFLGKYINQSNFNTVSLNYDEVDVTDQVWTITSITSTAMTVTYLDENGTYDLNTGEFVGDGTFTTETINFTKQ